jgi:hypothetical protein
MAKTLRLTVLVLALVLAPALAHAQLGIYRANNAAIGETYHLEFSYGWWDPAPLISFATGELQAIGTQIDGVSDLGFQQRRIRDLHLVVRPAKKHKIRFEYLPVSYTAETTLPRTLTFNGKDYTLGVPVSSTLDWKTYQFGYEYDIVYRDRGFFGVMGAVEYAHLQASLDSPVAQGAIDERTPIPSLGATARLYPARFVSVTGEVSLFKVVKSSIVNASGTYVDYDLYGTVNFSDYLGVQGGYRSRDVSFSVTDTWGALKLKGLYFRGVVRF